MADMSRWSCAPKLGDGEATACSIRYTLGTAFALSELRLGEVKRVHHVSEVRYVFLHVPMVDLVEKFPTRLRIPPQVSSARERIR